MEVVLGLVGLGLGVIAVISAYIWRANGRYIKMLREEIAQDMKMLQEGQREIVQGLNQIALIARSS